MADSQRMTTKKKLAVSIWIRLKKKHFLRRWIRKIRRASKRKYLAHKNSPKSGQNWTVEHKQIPSVLGPRQKNNGGRVHNSPLLRYGSVSVRMVRYGLLTCRYRASIVKRNRLNNHAGKWLPMYVCVYVSVCICMYLYVCMNMYVYVSMYIVKKCVHCIYVCICMYV